MDTPFIGQIELFGFNFTPRGWASCDGQLLAIAQNDALFALIGTIYGGDGRTTFGLPDLRGRVAIGMGTGPGLSPYSIGELSGNQEVTLLSTQVPSHSHVLMGVGSEGDNNDPSGKVLAKSSATLERGSTPVPANGYLPSTAGSSLAFDSIGMSGGNLSHNNMQPSVVLNYCIALEGIFPSRN